MSTPGWLSEYVEKTCSFFVGMVVFLDMSVVCSARKRSQKRGKRGLNKRVALLQYVQYWRCGRMWPHRKVPVYKMVYEHNSRCQDCRDACEACLHHTHAVACIVPLTSSIPG